jgi:predicted AlkP superfamily pyrophosphatase or phosphodiesterase
VAPAQGASENRMKAQANRVILIVIDGCRPDALKSAATPNISRLMSRGAYTLAAKTVTPSDTLPVHFSIFTSLTPAAHNVLTNRGQIAPSPGATSIVDLAKRASKTASAFYNWEQLAELFPPGILNYSQYMANALREDGDREIAEAAAGHITGTKPDFCFIFFGRLDEVGHRFGFMSHDYLQGVEQADRAVGLLLTALERANLMDHYHVILQSDHGGIGTQHREAVPEVMTVPWVAAGPDIREGHLIKSSVSVLDTAPTSARLLGIPPHPDWQGTAVGEIFK